MPSTTINFKNNSRGIAFIFVLIFLFVVLSFVLLLFFRNTINTMREYRKREEALMVNYASESAFSVAFSKLEKYFFQPDRWLPLGDEIPDNFPPTPDETVLAPNTYLFSIEEKETVVVVRYIAPSSTGND